MSRFLSWPAAGRALALALALAGVLGAGVGLATAQYNERQVRRIINVEDKSEDITARESKIWVLDFNFKDPRLITVDIPGRGRKLCWYLWYQVVNRTGEPRTFVPEFELVTLDKPGRYVDQDLPSVQEAIRRIEDPVGVLKIKNSVTISSEPVPVTKPESAPRAVTGVAIWDDVDPDSNRYSIFVSGLSNGWSLAEVPPDNKQVLRRKTLQLNFKRVGDRYYQHSDEIRFVPPAEWVYRMSSVTVGNGKADAPKKDKDKDQTLLPANPITQGASQR
jgi:hypothetical protein